MVRTAASGYSKGISDTLRSIKVMSAAIQMTSQGRAVILSRILEFGGCS